MKRMFGFFMFCFGLGMMIKVFLPNTICIFLLNGLILFWGIWLIQDKNRHSRKWDRFFYSLKRRK